jgi:hypothetical protein
MKYNFEEKTLDEYVLHYTNVDGEEKNIPFKRTVELAKKIQSSDAEARIKLFSYLTEIGKTKKDFIIERKENGKIIVDETNYRELESEFLERQQLETAMDIYRSLFNMELPDLLIDMGLDTQEKVQDFSLELREILINGKVKTPRIQEIQ